MLVHQWDAVRGNAFSVDLYSVDVPASDRLPTLISQGQQVTWLQLHKCAGAHSTWLCA
jgi:hypothetical protein